MSEIAALTREQESNLDHIWHTWINHRQKERDKTIHEHSLYEFKSMLQFLSYGHEVIKQAFEGKLPTIHKQCSHSPELPIINNVLKCALGTEVKACPILLSLQKSFVSELERIYPFNGKKAYPELSTDVIYIAMARTCAWHMYRESCGVQEGFRGVDTSEGWLMDASDRMFWDNVYQSLSAGDPGDLEEPK